MGYCRHYLKLNNDEYRFNSDEELNDFVFNNRHKFNDEQAKFSIDFDVQSATVSKIRAIMKEAEDIKKDEYIKNSKDLLSIGEKSTGSSDYFPVSKIHTLLNPQEYNKPFVSPLIIEDYIASQLVEYQTKLKPDGSYYKWNTETDPDYIEALKLINNKIEGWKVSAELGNYIHKLSELFFAYPELDTNKLKEKLAIEFPDTFKIDSTLEESERIKQEDIKNTILNNSIEGLIRLKETIEASHKGAVYITEAPIRATGFNDSKYSGRIDLIAVDKNGIPHIYDFKTSSDDQDQWKQIKIQTFKYQLGMYRQMLDSHGLNMKQTTMTIVPIHLKGMNINTKTFDAVSFDNTRLIDLQKTGKTGHGALDYPNGYITKGLDYYLPVKRDTLMVGSTDVNEINDLIRNVTSTEAKLAITKTDVDKFLNYEAKHVNKKGEHYFINQITGKSQVLIGNDPVKIKEQIQIYFNELALSNVNECTKITNKIKPYIDGLSSVQSLSLKEGDYAKIISGLFSEFQNQGWRVIEDFNHLGILVLVNDNHKLYDVISITSNNIDKSLNLLIDNKTILGNYVSHSQVGDGRIFKGTHGNMELMRTMLIVNELMAKDSSFKDLKLGNIKVFNPLSNKNLWQFSDLLDVNFKRLIETYNSKTGKNIVNNFENGVINRMEPAERIAIQLEQLVENEGLNKINRNIYDHFTEQTSYPILKRLFELKDAFEKIGIGITTVDFTNPMHKMYWEINNAILYYKDIRFENETHDVYKYGLPGSATYFSANTLNPDKLSNELYKKAYQPMFEIITTRYSAEQSKHAAIFSKYRDATNMVSSSYNSFDHMFERNRDGKFDNKLRLKDPDIAKDLSAMDKEYLKYFLFNINKLRDPSIESENDEKVIDLKISGEWFEVPLMRGGKYNRFTSGGSLMDSAKDLLDEQLNVNQQLSSENINAEHKNTREFLEIVNSMIIRGDSRDSLIDDKGTGYFSRDLKHIFESMLIKSITAEEKNKILPIIRAAIIFRNGYGDLTGIQQEELVEYLIKSSKLQLYNMKNIPANLKPAYKLMGVLQYTFSKMVIAGNPVSATREVIQGMYNNFLRFGTKSFGNNLPSMENLREAYKLTGATLLANPRHESLLNGLNKMFGIVATDIHSLQERTSTPSNAIFLKLGRGGLAWKANELGDWSNRMSILLSFMVRDGSFKAHVWDGNTMHYDWNKDDRFSTFHKYMNDENKIPDLVKDTYNKQKGLYVYMINKFKFDGLRNDNESLPNYGKVVEYGDALPLAYTSEQITNIKDLSDNIHGFLNQTNSTMFKNMFAGPALMMFHSYLNAKVNMYTLKGGYYTRGEVKQVTNPVTGKLMYSSARIDSEGKIIGWDDTEDPNGNVPKYQNIELFQEGLIDSIRRAVETANKQGWKVAMGDEKLKSNLTFLASDLAIALSAFLIYSFGINWKDEKKDIGTTATSLMKTPFQATFDNNVFSVLNAVMQSSQPPAVALIQNLNKTIMNFAVNPSIGTGKKVIGNNAMAKSILGIVDAQ